jgi:hypothetical protein
MSQDIDLLIPKGVASLKYTIHILKLRFICHYYLPREYTMIAGFQGGSITTYMKTLAAYLLRESCFLAPLLWAPV